MSVRLSADIKHPVSWPGLRRHLNVARPSNSHIPPPLSISSLHHTHHSLELQIPMGEALERIEAGALGHCGRLAGPPKPAGYRLAWWQALRRAAMQTSQWKRRPMTSWRHRPCRSMPASPCVGAGTLHRHGGARVGGGTPGRHRPTKGVTSSSSTSTISRRSKSPTTR